MFKEQLSELVSRIDGARGALIMGIDGIAVEKYNIEGDDLNLEAFAAEYLGLLKRTFETNNDLGVGTVKELTVFAEQLVAIIKLVTSEYYLIFALPPDGNFGRARFEMRKAMLSLERELS